MALGGESGAVQRPFVRYAVEAGWKYLSSDDALHLRAGGVTSPVLDAALMGQLAKLNPGIVNESRARDIVRRLVRVRPTIEGNLDAWEFLKGLKTVFVDTEKRERNVQLLDPANVRRVQQRRQSPSRPNLDGTSDALKANLIARPLWTNLGPSPPNALVGTKYQATLPTTSAATFFHLAR